MQELINKIRELKQEWDELKPIDKVYEDRLWEKFRLEWNYNSNHIEGNTMTYGDTELLLRLGDEFKPKDNSLKDVNEMRAHDTAIYLIKEWAGDQSRALTEKDIRELNEIILVKDFFAEAQTPEGKPTRRLIKVGEYKKHPNHVRLQSGELFRYAEPMEVPKKMEELVSWYNSELDEHPIVTSAFLHYKFVCIHPFDDGNGRVSRLIMNYHLMKHGYPPLIIKSADKQNYLYALNQADTGDTDAFVKYVTEQLLWSLEISIKAAKEEDIEEPGDLYKEISVWKKQRETEIKAKPQRNDELSIQVYENSIEKLFNEIESKVSLFNDSFKHISSSRILLNENQIVNQIQELKTITKETLGTYRYNKEEDELRGFRMFVELDSPVNKGANSKIEIAIIIDLNPYQYIVSIENIDIPVLEKNYTQNLVEIEINSLTEKFMAVLFEKVKEATS